MQLIDPCLPLNYPDLRLRYIKNFIPSTKADDLYRQLLTSTKWRQDKITVFGKTYDQPRLTALFAEGGLSYSYSGLKMDSQTMTPELGAIRENLQSQFGIQFNAVLLNLYRTGADSNGWHSDDEPELGINPNIASISLGEDRIFQMRHKHIKNARFKFVLESGSLLIMSGPTQHQWQHQLPKTKKTIGQRINLTYRYLTN